MGQLTHTEAHYRELLRALAVATEQLADAEQKLADAHSRIQHLERALDTADAAGIALMITAKKLRAERDHVLTELRGLWQRMGAETLLA